MLWSSTTIRERCARQGVRIRQGQPGEEWPGYLPGQIFHEHAAADLIARGCQTTHPLPAPRPLGLLGPVAQRDHRMMIERLNDQGYMDPPEDAVVEGNYMLVLDADGSPMPWCRDGRGDLAAGPGYRVQAAPDWAVRGSDWDPSRAVGLTCYRLQPDVWFLALEEYQTPAGEISTRWVLVLWDWKTAQGLVGHQSLAEDVQTITYCAAMALYCQERPDLPDPEVVRFVYVNPRFGAARMAEAPPEDWMEEARQLWQGCVECDDLPAQHHEDRAAWGDHCGLCPYRLECRPNTPAVVSDRALYDRMRHAQQQAKDLAAQHRARCKDRMSPLELPDGTVIGPQQVPAVSLPRVSKRHPEGRVPAMREAMSRLGQDWPEHFDIKGSARAWAAGLPQDVLEAVEPWLTRKTRTVYQTTPVSQYRLPDLHNDEE